MIYNIRGQFNPTYCYEMRSFTKEDLPRVCELQIEQMVKQFRYDLKIHFDDKIDEVCRIKKEDVIESMCNEFECPEWVAERYYGMVKESLRVQ